MACIALGAALVEVAVAAPGQDQSAKVADLVPRARALATGGHRDEALGLLHERLLQTPDDSDARVLYGIVLSWQGRYQEAREQLMSVLAKNPTHGDALPALINVELWSDHPEKALELAQRGLAKKPDDTTLLLAQARAQIDLKKKREARDTLNRILSLEPQNEDAVKMRRRLVRGMRVWEADADFDYEWFDHGLSPWQEIELSLRYHTPRGTVIGRASQAQRFGYNSHLYEIEWYPHIRTGTYGYVNFGYSPDANLYPRTRVAADIYQMLRWGLEGAVGYRRLNFSSSKINIFVPALGKYYGNWYFTGRAFLTPDTLGVSHTVLVSARRLFGEEGVHDYLGIRLSEGAGLTQARSLLEIQVLKSSSATLEFDKSFGRRWGIEFTGGASKEDRTFARGIWHRRADGTIYFIF
jgi:YaiO family outer membrane protein